eukprot:TRINITY_DN33696_c0_g1_i1.p1 TRINITY_DN33696_c0_g1~~TRINITY_DN33696_c0_g1_i1.p1  ORF type:complete len:422 (-),score=79.95 TRINITY_DN33696_c0_g1_i1:414-1679(-)
MTLPAGAHAGSVLETLAEADFAIRQLRADHEALRSEVETLKEEVAELRGQGARPGSSALQVPAAGFAVGGLRGDAGQRGRTASARRMPQAEGASSQTGVSSSRRPSVDSTVGRSGEFRKLVGGGLFKAAQPLLKADGPQRAKIPALRAVETILKNGASPNEWQGSGCPLREAVRAHSIELVQALLKGKADAAESDDKGVSLLHLAVFDGQDEICKLLLASGVDPNFTDCHGQTPLFFAPTRAVCNTLYKSHADMNAMNLKGQSALHLAAKAGLGEVLVWMSTRVSQALLCLRDAHDHMALDYARQVGVKPVYLEKLEQAASNGSSINPSVLGNAFHPAARSLAVAPGSDPETDLNPLWAPCSQGGVIPTSAGRSDFSRTPEGAADAPRTPRVRVSLESPEDSETQPYSTGVPELESLRCRG